VQRCIVICMKELETKNDKSRQTTKQINKKAIGAVAGIGIIVWSLFWVPETTGLGTYEEFSYHIVATFVLIVLARQTDQFIVEVTG